MVFSAESNEDCKQISSLETVKEQHGQIWQKDVSTGTREKVCVSISGLQGGQLSAEGSSVKWNSPKGSCRIILECIFPSFLHPKIIWSCMFCVFSQRGSDNQYKWKGSKMAMSSTLGYNLVLWTLSPSLSPNFMEISIPFYVCFMRNMLDICLVPQIPP